MIHTQTNESFGKPNKAMGGHNKETIVNIISRHLSSEKHVEKKIR
jgi:hypothetical protein